MPSILICNWMRVLWAPADFTAALAARIASAHMLSPRAPSTSRSPINLPWKQYLSEPHGNEKFVLVVHSDKLVHQSFPSVGIHSWTLPYKWRPVLETGTGPRHWRLKWGHRWITLGDGVTQIPTNCINLRALTFLVPFQHRESALGGWRIFCLSIVWSLILQLLNHSGTAFNSIKKAKQRVKQVIDQLLKEDRRGRIDNRKKRETRT